MKTQDTAWALFSGNTYLPAYTHSTRRGVIQDCLNGFGFRTWDEAKRKGLSVRKVTVSWANP